MYPAVALVEHSREQIPRWNALRLKRGAEFWRVRVLDSTYPVRFGPTVYADNAKEVDALLDERPWDEKHPIRTAVVTHGPVINLAINLLGMWF